MNSTLSLLTLAVLTFSAPLALAADPAGSTTSAPPPAAAANVVPAPKPLVETAATPNPSTTLPASFSGTSAVGMPVDQPAAGIENPPMPKGDTPDLNFDSYPDKTNIPKAKKVVKHTKKVKKAKPMVETVEPETPPGFRDVAPLQANSSGRSNEKLPPLPDTHLGIPEVEVGLSVQPFQAAGRIGLSGLQPYDVSTVGTQPMGAIDFSWFPWQFDLGQPVAIGLFASMGYSRGAISLTNPQGQSVSGTELASLKAEGGVTFAWQPNLASIYRLRAQLGGGQWNENQTSDADFANHSAYEYFGSAGLFGDIHFMPRSAPALALYVGFDYRTPLSAEPQEIVLQRNNFVAGIAGTFQ